MLLLNTTFSVAVSSNQIRLKNFRLVFLLVVLVFSGLAGLGQTTLAKFQFNNSLSPDAGAIGSPVIVLSNTNDFGYSVNWGNPLSSLYTDTDNRYIELTSSTVGYESITVKWDGGNLFNYDDKRIQQWLLSVNSGTGYGSTIYTQNLTDNWITIPIQTLSSLFNDNSQIKIRITSNLKNNRLAYIDNLIIQGTPISLPTCSTPVSPLSNAINFPVNANLTWNAVSGASGYRIYFGIDAAATNILNGTDLGNVTVYNHPSDLIPNTTYYWRIVPYNSLGPATGCQTWEFMTEETFTYCSASSTVPTEYESITNVTFAGINNPSPVAKTVGYTDYSSTVSPGVVYQGQDYTVSVTEQFLSDLYGGYCKIYIDFNQNGTFDLPDEYVFGNPYSDNMTMTGTISIPVTASLGLTRMRVVLEGDADNTGALPCGTFNWGEVEDYSINILEPCSDATLTLNTGNNNQTVCEDEEINPIQYTIGGSATGATVTGLPAGVSGSYNSTSHVFTISGTPTVAGDFEYTVTSTGTPTGCNEATATGTLTVNPIPSATISGSATICEGLTTPISIDFTGTGPWEVTTLRNDADPVTVFGITDNPYTFDVSAAGTYTISAFNDDLCDGTFSGSAVVTVNPLPIASITGDNGPLCAGDNAEFYLSGTSGATVTYKINSGSDQTVTLTGGTATITLTNVVDDQVLTLVSVTNGTCSQSLSATETITVNPLPEIGSFINN